MAISLGTAGLIGSGISGIGSLIGGGKGASAATQAAQIQAQAAQQAAQLQFAQFQQFQSNLQPWMQAGQGALGELMQQLPGYIAPINTQLGLSGLTNNNLYSMTGGQGAGMTFAPQGISSSWQPTMAELAATPGYQFSLQQGLQAVTNQNAAQGLAGYVKDPGTGALVPGGALGKGLANYAEGLAGTTYQNQFQNWLSQLGTQYNIFSGQLGQEFGIFQGQNALNLQQRQQQFNMLGGIAGTGQNAAVNLGTSGLQAAGQAANALTSGAAATAGGIVGSANAINAGIGGAANAASSGLTNYALLNALTGQGGGFGNTAAGYSLADVAASGGNYGGVAGANPFNPNAVYGA